MSVLHWEHGVLMHVASAGLACQKVQRPGLGQRAAAFCVWALHERQERLCLAHGPLKLGHLPGYHLAPRESKTLHILWGCLLLCKMLILHMLDVFVSVLFEGWHDLSILAFPS